MTFSAFHATKSEIRALASQVVVDRLNGFAVTGGSKGRVTATRIVEPTEAELAWDAFLTESRTR